eukprot:CAMPEP_0172502200 /NCGR_PEP_ID=MMETSP1066-20121228/157731_1 /TAXON_ID=671091 /ORGANISM="Coscinodiscus wailesii, Strain CCMP2513" /LENGTH=138 /DNA_ID=CAMNT_0013277371 /DNA_START=91 /DNA_END=507 /DNA_ORIENTATION=-
MPGRCGHSDRGIYAMFQNNPNYVLLAFVVLKFLPDLIKNSKIIFSVLSERKIARELNRRRIESLSHVPFDGTVNDAMSNGGATIETTGTGGNEANTNPPSNRSMDDLRERVESLENLYRDLNDQVTWVKMLTDLKNQQ